MSRKDGVAHRRSGLIPMRQNFIPRLKIPAQRRQSIEDRHRKRERKLPDERHHKPESRRRLQRFVRNATQLQPMGHDCGAHGVYSFGEKEIRSAGESLRLAIATKACGDGQKCCREEQANPQARGHQEMTWSEVHSRVEGEAAGHCGSIHFRPSRKAFTDEAGEIRSVKDDPFTRTAGARSRGLFDRWRSRLRSRHVRLPAFPLLYDLDQGAARRAHVASDRSRRFSRHGRQQPRDGRSAGHSGIPRTVVPQGGHGAGYFGHDRRRKFLQIESSIPSHFSEIAHDQR